MSSLLTDNIERLDKYEQDLLDALKASNKMNVIIKTAKEIEKIRVQKRVIIITQSAMKSLNTSADSKMITGIYRQNAIELLKVTKKNADTEEIVDIHMEELLKIINGQITLF